MFHLQSVREFHELEELGTAPPPCLSAVQGVSRVHIQTETPLTC